MATLVALMVAHCAPEPGSAGLPASDPASTDGPPTSNPDGSRPNLLLITLDTTRADHLGCYGYFRNTSPHLDAFAQECLVFEQCIAPMATTLPSHTAILTSTFPLENRVLSNLLHGQARFTETAQLKSFATFCQAADYQTAAFISAAPLKKGTGIEAGFEHFDQPMPKERSAESTTRAVRKWLDQADPRPFLVWVHYFDPHWPYEAGEIYRQKFATDEELDNHLRERQIPDRAPRPMVQLTEDSRQVHNQYDAEISYLDEQIGKLIDEFRTRRDWDRTAVVITADHGEGLCQHQEAAHGGTWFEQVHAPLLMRIPGRPQGRFKQLLSSVDILPTLLGTMPMHGLEGFLSQAHGKNALAVDYQERPILSMDSGRVRDRPGYRLALTTSRWRYFSVQHGEQVVAEHLFDLRNDPYELQDVAAENAEVLQQLRQALQAEVEKQRANAEVLLADVAPQIGPTDPDMIDQLRSLGYVDDEDGKPDPPADRD
jgi:arylsulfatase